jgi:hypothetical protein
VEVKMRTGRLVAAVASLVLVTWVRADQVVYFKNGTYMRVQGHEVQGEMVRVRLDASASMAFPSRMIDKIEDGHGVVFGTPSQVQANQAVPGPPRSESPSYPVTGNPAIANRARSDRAKVSDAPPAEAGIAVPDVGSDDASTMMGSIRSGPSGSTQIGNRYQIDTGKGPGKSNFVPATLQMKSSGVVSTPPQQQQPSPFQQAFPRNAWPPPPAVGNRQPAVQAPEHQVAVEPTDEGTDPQERNDPAW